MSLALSKFMLSVSKTRALGTVPSLETPLAPFIFFFEFSRFVFCKNQNFRSSITQRYDFSLLIALYFLFHALITSWVCLN